MAHPSVTSLLQWFECDHLAEEIQPLVRGFRDLAHTMAACGKGPELSAGLRKLLEAKDCAVRARLEANPALRS